MPTDDPHNLDRVDQEIRINETRERVREKAGGEMTCWEDPALPLDMQEQFWQQIEAYENAPDTCEHERFRKQGITLPSPEELTDEQLHQKLWEVIHALARRNTFLSSTDHLSDRELYTHLVEEAFWEASPDLPEEILGDGGFCAYLDIIGSGSEDDILIYLTYYAGDDERAEWTRQFPDYALPAKRLKPYDRDRTLPVSKDEQERRAWLESMHAQGYTDEDIHRMAREELEREGLPECKPESDASGPHAADEDIPY